VFGSAFFQTCVRYCFIVVGLLQEVSRELLLALLLAVSISLTLYCTLNLRLLACKAGLPPNLCNAYHAVVVRKSYPVCARNFQLNELQFHCVRLLVLES